MSKHMFPTKETLIRFFVHRSDSSLQVPPPWLRVKLKAIVTADDTGVIVARLGTVVIKIVCRIYRLLKVDPQKKKILMTSSILCSDSSLRRLDGLGFIQSPSIPWHGLSGRPTVNCMPLVYPLPL